MPTIHTALFQLQLPPGAMGPEPITSDVRCFLLAHASGVVLVDAGLPGGAEAIGAALARMSASWSDVSDLVVTHAHFDHIGGLPDVLLHATAATVRAGRADAPAVQAAAGGRQVQALEAGESTAGWIAMPTPGHTPGHLCLLHEGDGVLLAGDAVGSVGGALTRAPSMFTDNPDAAEASLRQLAGLAVARLITSHGDELPDGPTQLAELVG